MHLIITLISNCYCFVLLAMTKNNPITASERQRRVKIAATVTTKVHVRHKRRNIVATATAEQSEPLPVEREKPAELSPESKEAVPQRDESCIKCPSPSRRLCERRDMRMHRQKLQVQHQKPR